MGKAPKSDGYPRWNKKTRVWEQWLDLGRDEDGKRLRKRVTGKTRNAVKEKITELRTQIKKGINVRAKPQTIADLARTYLDTINVRPRTHASYRYVIERFIVPNIGTLSARKMAASDVRKLLVKLKSEPLQRQGPMKDEATPKLLSGNTIALVRTVLYQVMELAIADDLRDDNPVSRAPSITRDETPTRALSDEQAHALLVALKGDRLEMAIRLLLGLGLRRGECVALQLDDINLEAGTLRIDATMGYVSKELGNLYGPPKTTSSKRTLSLPSRLKAALSWYLRQRELEQKAMNWPDSPWLFRSIRNGGKLNDNTLYLAFKRAAAKAGLVGFSPHSLRHSTATFLHAEGVPLVEIASVLGHSNLDELARYLHTLPGEQSVALGKLDDRIDRTSPEWRSVGA